MSSFINRFGGQGGMVGQASIDRALASGMTINQIRSALSNQGVGTGAKATSFLAARPASSFVSQYGGTRDQSAAGLASVTRAMGSGMSIKDIQDQAMREVVAFGPAAQQFLTKSAVEDQSKQFEDKITNLQNQFNDQYKQLSAQLQQERADSKKAMDEMQGSFAQAMSQRDSRPRVESIRFADRGTGGATQRQLQRRGVRGTFGRAGERLMKISSLNV